MCERLRELVGEGLSSEQIAKRLHQEGYHPPKQAERFSRQAVHELLGRLGLRRIRNSRRGDLGENEWWLAELGRALDIPKTTLHAWVRRGWVKARQQEDSKRWIAWADEAEIERLRGRRAQPEGHAGHQRWMDCVSPRIVAARPSTSENA